MATNTAATAGSNAAPAPLWQVPVFVFGVAALAAVWFGRPWISGTGRVRIDRQLAEARAVLKRPDGDADYALKLARRVLEADDLPAGKRGEASFLAGSALVQLAEAAEAAAARENWRQAREALEQAERAGLGEDDMRQLTYRLGKAAYHTGDNPARVIALLEGSIEFVEARAEGYALITQAALALKPPDLNKALEANTRLRDVVDATPAEQTAAQLVAGEIYLRMGKPQEARLALKNIKEPAASPAVILKARLLMARGHQEEGHWNEAARLYELARNETRTPVPEPAIIHYNLGVCYRRLDQVDAAAKAFQACLKIAQGPEGPAAALSLADLRLADADREPVLEMLALAVARVDPATGWTNPLFDRARATEVFERAVKAMRESGQHELAARALDAYSRLAETTRLTILRTEAKADWARSLAGAGKEPVPPEQLERARGLFAEAAEGYAGLAARPGLAPAERAGCLWLCAQNARSAGKTEQARVCLEEYVKLNLEPARMGEAWYQLGEIYAALKNKEQAGVAFRNCLQFDDVRAACRARYQLAMAALEANEPDEAEAALVLNVKMLQWGSDREALRDTIFALGNLLYQRRQYSRAVRWLEEICQRFKDAPEVFRSRYQLADSYRQLALQGEQNGFLGSRSTSEETRRHFEKQRNAWREKAAKEFAALEARLDTAEGREMLTPELRLQVPFITAKCLLFAGQAEKALPIYEKLSARHAGKYEELEALGGAVACCAELRDVGKVQQRLLQIEQLLPKLPADVRGPWQAWLRTAKEGLPRNGAAEPSRPGPAAGGPAAKRDTVVPAVQNGEKPAETTFPVASPGSRRP